MYKSKKTVSALAFVIAAVMLLAAGLCVPVSAAYTVRGNDYTTPREGSVIVGVEGTFVKVGEKEKNTILARVNAIRKEACDERVPYPGNRSKKLSPGDYTPIKWSRGLEMVAALRSVESSIYLGHGRLAKGHTSVWDNNYGVDSNAENLAWNWLGPELDALMMGIDQWYSEKEIWVSGSPGVTGHYTSMIDPGLRYIGIACFYNENAAYRATIADQMAMYGQHDPSVAGLGGDVAQKIEIDPALIDEMELSGAKEIAVGKKTALTPRVTVGAGSGIGSSSGCGPIFTGVTWSSSDNSVATVDKNGSVTGVSAGKAVITAKVGSFAKASLTVTVKDGAKSARGDADLNGTVNAKDARLVLRASADLETLKGQAFKNCDLDGDGVLIAKEARLILRFSANLEKSI